MKRLGWTADELLSTPIETLEASVVDCGSCPVNLSCAVRRGGNGYKYACCGSTAVVVEGLITVSGICVSPSLLVMDCARNRFETSPRVLDLKELCVLCKAEHFALVHLLNLTPNHRIVPTVHAKVPLRERVAAWRAAEPAAQARVEEIRKQETK